MESSVEWNLAFGHAQNLESNIGALFNEDFVSGYEILVTLLLLVPVH